MEYRTMRLTDRVTITVPRELTLGQESDLIRMYEGGTDQRTVEAIARALFGDMSQMVSFEQVLKELGIDPPAPGGMI